MKKKIISDIKELLPEDKKYGKILYPGTEDGARRIREEAEQEQGKEQEQGAGQTHLARSRSARTATSLLGPTGILPEDLVAGISRLSVIQEADIAAVAIAVHGAGTTQAPVNTSDLSTYFGSPLSSGDSVFDSLATPGGRPCRSRAGSEGQGGTPSPRPASSLMS